MGEWALANSDHVDFIVVYIAEAHATDGWPLGNFVEIPNHTCIADREKASSLMHSKFGLSPSVPIYLDTMSDSFDKEFAVWPERYYIVHEGKLKYVAEPNHEFGYERKDFLQALAQFSYSQYQAKMAASAPTASEPTAPTAPEPTA